MSSSYKYESSYERKMSSNGMDSTISNLKFHLFDLEQQEKDYNCLCQKLAQLKKEVSNLANLKSRLEQELKQKDESYNQRVSNLRGENENLEVNYNEKISLNKTLFKENDALEKEIEARDDEINDLKNRLRDLNNQLGRSLGDKGDLDNQVQKLRNINKAQNNEINKLTKENKDLNDIINDQNRRLQKDQEEIAMLNNKSNENDIDIQNLNGKLRNLVDDVNNTKNALNKNNMENRDLDDKIRNLECQCANLKCENNNLNNNILKEKSLRCEKERQNQHLNDCINDSDNQIYDLENKYNDITSLYEQVSIDSKNCQADNNKLKQHVMLLNQEKQNLLCELEKAKCRKEQSCLLLRGAQNCIEQSNICTRKVENEPLKYCYSNNLRNCGERMRVYSSEHYRSCSPRY